MKKLTLIIWLFCVCQILSAQKSKIGIQIGLESNLTWLQGSNELKNIDFSKNWQKPNLPVSVSYKIDTQLSITSSFKWQLHTTNYTISSIDIFNNPVELKYKNETLFIPVSVQINYKPFQSFPIILSVGGFYSRTVSSKWRLLNLSDFDVPTVFFNYGLIELNNSNYGVQFGITQPLFSWKLSSLDLGIHYMLGLKNVNKDKENPLKTRLLGASLVWNVNLKRRK